MQRAKLWKDNDDGDGEDGDGVDGDGDDGDDKVDWAEGEERPAGGCAISPSNSQQPTSG